MIYFLFLFSTTPEVYMFEQAMTKNKLRKIRKTYNYYKDTNASSFTKYFFHSVAYNPSLKILDDLKANFEREMSLFNLIQISLAIV